MTRASAGGASGRAPHPRASWAGDRLTRCRRLSSPHPLARSRVKSSSAGTAVGSVVVPGSLSGAAGGLDVPPSSPSEPARHPAGPFPSGPLERRARDGSRTQGTSAGSRTDGSACRSAGDDILEDAAARFTGRLVRKRDGRVAPFDRSRIAHAVEMAVRAELGCPFPDPIAARDRRPGRRHRRPRSSPRCPMVAEGEVVATVEEIQDEVERALMAAGRLRRRPPLHRLPRGAGPPPRRAGAAAARRRWAGGAAQPGPPALLDRRGLRRLRGPRLGQGDCRRGAGGAADRRAAGSIWSARSCWPRGPRIEMRPGLLVRRGAGAAARYLRRGAGAAGRHRRGPRRLRRGLRRVRPARGRAGAAGAGDARLRSGAAGRGARRRSGTSPSSTSGCRPSTTAT